MAANSRARRREFQGSLAGASVAQCAPAVTTTPDLPETPDSNHADLRAELDRLDQELLDLRKRLATEADALQLARGRCVSLSERPPSIERGGSSSLLRGDTTERRLARTSRLASTRQGSRPPRAGTGDHQVVVSLAERRASRLPPPDDDGPEAA